MIWHFAYLNGIDPKRVEDAPARYELRQQVLAVFDIKVIYTVRDDTLLVVAVFHGHRRPGYWLERLQKLG